MFSIKFIYLFFIILSAIMLTNKAYSSAWLIAPDKYRYTITASNIDQSSKHIKSLRADLRLTIADQLQHLRKKLKSFNKTSASYKRLFSQIKQLEHIFTGLSSYQDELTRTFSVEYGINEKQNMGIQFLYQKNQLQGSKYHSKIFYKKEMTAFYKVKLFQNNNRIISIQPQVTFASYSGKQQLSYELLLISGIIKNGRFLSLFTENSFSFGENLNVLDKKSIYYTASITKGIKFKNDIMLINFIKYYIRRKNYNYIYHRTMYNQLSIAKSFKLGHSKQDGFTIQAGYFLDKSLIKPHYKISGVNFSIWIDV